jgi:hypothetical protein
MFRGQRNSSRKGEVLTMVVYLIGIRLSGSVAEVETSKVQEGLGCSPPRFCLRTPHCAQQSISLSLHTWPIDPKQQLYLLSSFPLQAFISMFSRLTQVARHLSRPLPNYMHRSAAALTSSSQSTMTSSIPTVNAQGQRMIYTAGCLIIGDEVLGGKVCLTFPLHVSGWRRAD